MPSTTCDCWRRPFRPARQCAAARGARAVTRQRLDLGSPLHAAGREQSVPHRSHCTSVDPQSVKQSNMPAGPPQQQPPTRLSAPPPSALPPLPPARRSCHPTVPWLLAQTPSSPPADCSQAGPCWMPGHEPAQVFAVTRAISQHPCNAERRTLVKPKATPVPRP